MKKEKKQDKDLVQLNVVDLNKLSEESITLLNKVDSLITVLSTKSEVNTEDNVRKQYQYEFYNSLVSLEKNINVLRYNLLEFHTRSENIKLEDIITKYNSISKRIKDNNITINLDEIVSEKIINKELNQEEADALMNKMIEELKQAQDNNSNGKTLQIKIPKGGFIQGLINLVITVVFNLIIVIAFSGLIKWCTYDNFFDLVLFTLYYSMIEGLLKLIILTAFKDYLIKSFGLILYIPVLIALFATCMFPLFVEITNIYLFVVVIILASLLRKYIANYLLEKTISSTIKKMEKSKGKKEK